jgi:hypothetical protein
MTMDRDMDTEKDMDTKNEMEIGHGHEHGHLAGSWTPGMDMDAVVEMDTCMGILHGHDGHGRGYRHGHQEWAPDMEIRMPKVQQVRKDEMYVTLLGFLGGMNLCSIFRDVE